MEPQSTGPTHRQVHGQGQETVQPTEQDAGQRPVDNAKEQTWAQLAAAGLGHLNLHGAWADPASHKSHYKRDFEEPAPEGYYGAQPGKADLKEVAKRHQEDQQRSTRILMVHDKNPERPQTYIVLSRNDPSTSSTFLRFQLESTAVSPKM